MRIEDLYWLPEAPPDFNDRLKAVPALPQEEQWTALAALANTRMDFLRTQRLDTVASRLFANGLPRGLQTKPMRLAVLSSSTATQLLPALRVAALRRGFHLTCYEPNYGQYAQELRDKTSGLHAFRPNVVLFAFDAPHVTAGVHASESKEETRDELEAQLRGLSAVWTLAREEFCAQVLQQTILNRYAPLLGSNEHRLSSSPRQFVRTLNERLAVAADTAGVDLVDVDAHASVSGHKTW